MRNVSSQSCLLISANVAMRRMPALLTRMSSLPSVWTSASTARCTAAMSVTSAAATAPARLRSRTRSAVASAARPSTSITPTSQPSCAKRSAMPRPIPEPAPVTTAVLPSSAYMLAILAVRRENPLEPLPLSAALRRCPGRRNASPAGRATCAPACGGRARSPGRCARRSACARPRARRAGARRRAVR